MKRMLTRLFLPELLLAGLLTGCACGMVEDIIPEEARLVEVGFVKPDLGIPACRRHRSAGSDSVAGRFNYTDCCLLQE